MSDGLLICGPGEQPGHLQNRLTNSRVVFLGEADHFIHEKVDFRLFWIRLLAQHRPLLLAEEFGRSDAFRANRYLQTGDESWLDKIPTLGYRGDDRLDRNDKPTGVLKESQDNYPTELFRSEQFRFYRGLRQLVTDGCPIELAGIDINGSTGSVYEDVPVRLYTHVANVAGWMEMFARVDGENLDEELTRLRFCQSELTALGLPEQLNRAISDDIEVAVATLEFVRDAYPVGYEGLPGPLAARERLLQSQALQLLETSQRQSSTLICMAHCFHLARDDDHMGAANPTGPGGGVEHSFGHVLCRTLAEQPLAIWQLFGAGRDSQPFTSLPNEFDFSRESLNRRLASEVQAPSLLDVHASELGPGTSVGHMYNQEVALNLKVQTDFVHFYPEVSPMNYY